MELFTIFSLPFMQRALIAGLLIAPMLGLFGVIVNIRKMSFFGDGIAHASLAGIAIALFAGIAPLPISIAWAICIGGLVYIIERKTNLSTDSAIGMLFTGSMALGILLMSKLPGYQPELVSYLFGNILAIRHTDIIQIAMIVPILIAWLLFSFRSLTILSIQEDLARIRSSRVEWITFVFYILLSVALVLSVKMMGIILASALLIIPPSIAKSIASSYKWFILLTIFVSILMIKIGLILSYLTNTPSGAMIVLTGIGLFLISILWQMGKK